MSHKPNKPNKHHFVPEFYQKGFCNDAGELFAYKKTYGRIKSWTPSQILYEQDLHTIKLKNKETVMIEQFYSLIEGEFSKFITILRENINNNELIPYLNQNSHFIKLAKLLIATQFWRTPCKKELALQYSPQLVEFYDKADNEIKAMLHYDRKFVKYLSKRAKKDDSIKVIQFLLLPLLSFDLSKEANHMIFFRAPKERFFFSSDRPVIYDEYEKLFSFRSFLFPFSKELVLLGSEKDIREININKVNLLIEKKALEVVISGSKLQLDELRNYKSKKISQRNHDSI